MRIFFSAVKHREIFDYIYAQGGRSFLFSYEDPKGATEMVLYAGRKKEELTILIDSGAFTAWNSGLKVSIDSYRLFREGLNFNLGLEGITHKVHYINLDVIPHKKGTTPTKQQTLDACKKGVENYYWLFDRGMHTLHTFHQFDPWEYLEIILEHCNTDNYICISPANDQSLEARLEFMRLCYRIIPEGVRVHVLGLTARESLETYPVYSADSSTWLNPSKYGELFDYHRLLKINKEQGLTRHNARYLDHTGHNKYAIKYFVNLEKHATNLWKLRGLNWTN